MLVPAAFVILAAAQLLGLVDPTGAGVALSAVLAIGLVVVTGAALLIDHVRLAYVARLTAIGAIAGVAPADVAAPVDFSQLLDRPPSFVL